MNQDHRDSRIAELEAHAAALREALAQWAEYDRLRERTSGKRRAPSRVAAILHAYAMARDQTQALLADTATAAREYEVRIRREARREGARWAMDQHSEDPEALDLDVEAEAICSERERQPDNPRET